MGKFTFAEEWGYFISFLGRHLFCVYFSYCMFFSSPMIFLYLLTISLLHFCVWFPSLSFSSFISVLKCHLCASGFYKIFPFMCIICYCKPVFNVNSYSRNSLSTFLQLFFYYPAVNRPVEFILMISL